MNGKSLPPGIVVNRYTCPFRDLNLRVAIMEIGKGGLMATIIVESWEDVPAKDRSDAFLAFFNWLQDVAGYRVKRSLPRYSDCLPPNFLLKSDHE
jgi:hypothetical protein